MNQSMSRPVSSLIQQQIKILDDLKKEGLTNQQTQSSSSSRKSVFKTCYEYLFGDTTPFSKISIYMQQSVIDPKTGTRKQQKCTVTKAVAMNIINNGICYTFPGFFPIILTDIEYELDKVNFRRSLECYMLLPNRHTEIFSLLSNEMLENSKKVIKFTSINNANFDINMLNLPLQFFQNILQSVLPVLHISTDPKTLENANPNLLDQINEFQQKHNNNNTNNNNNNNNNLRVLPDYGMVINPKHPLPTFRGNGAFGMVFELNCFVKKKNCINQQQGQQQYHSEPIAIKVFQTIQTWNINDPEPPPPRETILMDCFLLHQQLHLLSSTTTSINNNSITNTSNELRALPWIVPRPYGTFNVLNDQLIIINDHQNQNSNNVNNSNMMNSNNSTTNHNNNNNNNNDIQYYQRNTTSFCLMEFIPTTTTNINRIMKQFDDYVHYPNQFQIDYFQQQQQSQQSQTLLEPPSLAPNVIKDLTIGLCKGVKKMWKLGSYVQRDIKLDNIIVVEHNKGIIIPRLLDWGLGRSLPHNEITLCDTFNPDQHIPIEPHNIYQTIAMRQQIREQAQQQQQYQPQQQHQYDLMMDYHDFQSTTVGNKANRALDTDLGWTNQSTSYYSIGHVILQCIFGFSILTARLMLQLQPEQLEETFTIQCAKLEMNTVDQCIQMYHNIIHNWNGYSNQLPQWVEQRLQIFEQDIDFKQALNFLINHDARQRKLFFKSEFYKNNKMRVVNGIQQYENDVLSKLNDIMAPL